MYQRILVPLEGSHLAEQALPHARTLAQALSLRGLLVTATSGGGARRGIEPDPDVDGDPATVTILREDEYSTVISPGFCSRLESDEDMTSPEAKVKSTHHRYG